jgi:PIN domain nuclease of toxin-antitoxin system
MTLLLDSHTFLWFCQDDPALSSVAKSLIEDPHNQNLVSVASCWEIAIKAGLKKLRLGEPSSTYLPAALASTGFKVLAISVHTPQPLNRCRTTIVTRSIGCWWPKRCWKTFPS